LELAQYRELAGFAQFASDMDAATRRQLERGRRLMEIMKQDIHEPIPVAKQVAIIYAGTQGYLDGIPPAKIQGFESSLFEVLDREPAEYLKLFARDKTMSSEVKAALEAVLNRLAVKSKP
jgi:F-type H+-transporting ATPase subunit alpha